MPYKDKEKRKQAVRRHRLKVRKLPMTIRWKEVVRYVDITNTLLPYISIIDDQKKNSLRYPNGVVEFMLLTLY